MTSRKVAIGYHIDHDNGSFAVRCHVVYATLGLCLCEFVWVCGQYGLGNPNFKSQKSLSQSRRVAEIAKIDIHQSRMGI